MRLQMPPKRRSRPWLYAILILVLVACLWVGWRDFNPRIPQDELRQDIRMTIRWLMQVLVQYAIPGAIIIFFSKEALSIIRGKQRGSRT